MDISSHEWLSWLTIVGGGIMGFLAAFCVSLQSQINRINIARAEQIERIRSEIRQAVQDSQYDQHREMDALNRRMDLIDARDRDRRSEVQGFPRSQPRRGSSDS